MLALATLRTTRSDERAIVTLECGAVACVAVRHVAATIGGAGIDDVIVAQVCVDDDDDDDVVVFFLNKKMGFVGLMNLY